ncbi:MAG: hypothetical protein BWY22_01991 [Bacteroidetes bacterium ADurb.Bin217]|nr:MAG: hypothetical protein BWY22_01991 [Bacteroidetes bacterium ADurb.Bin217]
MAPAIVVSKNTICAYEEDPILTATPAPTGIIYWYKDDKTTFIQNGLTLQADRTKGTEYWVSQEVNGCEGEKASKSYKINPEPANPIVTGAAVCEGSDVIPVLTTNLPQDKWYGDALATDFKGTGITYTPEVAAVGSQDVTYYVVRTLQGCNSDTIPVVLTVVPIPTFEISPKEHLKCQSDAGEELKAINLKPDYHTNPAVSGGKIEWFQKGIKRGEGDTFIADTAQFLPGSINNITARYSVYIGSKTCKSEEVLMHYDVRRTPRIPIVNALPVCLGEYTEASDIIEIPILSMSEVEWSSPLLHNGDKQFTRKITLNGQQLQDIGVGNIPIEIIAFDKDLTECKSILNDNIKVSPMPDSHILGREKVCEGTIEEFYSVEFGDAANHYKWEVTGSNVMYSKDNLSGATRYIDWGKSGVDTISLMVTSPDFCMSADTLIVYKAKYPIADFDWELPGAMNIAEFTNLTIQDSIIEQTIDGVLVMLEVPYSMSWDFGRSYNQIGREVQYDDRKDIIREEYMYGPHDVTLQVTNEHGCVNTITKNIFVDIKANIEMPNAFAPTNPAYSVRHFQPVAHGVTKCEIWVYDVWGNLVWYSNEVEEGIFVGKWDGTYNGELLKSDTYIWKMEATFADGKPWNGTVKPNGTETKYGSVVLLR